MSTHVIIGAGPIGSALAIRLATDGKEVRVITRSGNGPVRPGIQRISADASDLSELRRHVSGGQVLYNCANPGGYQQWEAEWPPLAKSILTSAEESEAVLVTLSNLYLYGQVTVPMTTDLPLAATGHKGKLRAQMWRDALAAHEAGRVRAVEVRASDFIGPTVGAVNGMLARYAKKVLHGQASMVFGDSDAPHSWSYVEDIARTLATVGNDERSWGQAWHVPTAPPTSVRQVLAEMLAAIGQPSQAPRLRRMPSWVMKAMSTFVPLVRELDEVLWQFERPFEIDSRTTTETFDLEPTNWNTIVKTTAEGWQRSQ